MAQVTITLNGRTYRLQCGDGEEPRLIELADVVRGKLQVLVSEFGQAGDDRLLLMTALLIADELLETRAHLVALAQQPQPTPAAASGPTLAPHLMAGSPHPQAGTGAYLEAAAAQSAVPSPPPIPRATKPARTAS